MHPKDKIRNVAIIAHIDHGKTTLIDGVLRQSQLFRANQEIPERVMDSYDQEKERGITIFSKPTCIYYGDYKLNLIDTPGHADFSSEVERVLGMVNSVLLIVDAQEGPMPQTRFVLSKALAMGLRPLVVLNKIDRPHAEPDRVLNETFDLFVELGATDEQLDFAHCYASAIEGYAIRELDDVRENLSPLLDMIVEKTPAPSGDSSHPFLLQATTLYFDDYLGRQVCGRILQGKIRQGQTVKRIDRDGKGTTHAITRVESHLGLQRIEVDEASVGDIVYLSGIPEVYIGDTICAPEWSEPLPPIRIDPPTVSIDLSINNGPFVGQSGSHVTMNKIRDRLFKEKRSNVSYNISERDERTITIEGRGELHLAILLEAMRREGFEFCVARPTVILREENGRRQEPIAKADVTVPEEYSGTIIEQLALRRGEMHHLQTDEHGLCQMQFQIPVRGLVGYRNDFLTSTKGLGILTSVFDKYEDWKGEIIGRRRGVLVSMCAGRANAYASFQLKDRGELFTRPGDGVYEGMIVGENSREGDLLVNITRAKQLTNIRAAGSDENLLLPPPRQFTLEQAIGYINEDELVEITPDAIRLRKRHLSEAERNRAGKKK